MSEPPPPPPPPTPGLGRPETRGGRPAPVVLEDVRRLRVEPGDMLLVTVPASMPPEAMHDVSDKLHEFFPDNPSMVIAHGTDVQIVGRGGTRRGQTRAKGPAE